MSAEQGSKLRAVMLGAGSLGRAFLRRLRDRGGPVELVALLTAHHGRKMDENGIDPSLALNLVESEGLGDSAPEELPAVLESVRPNLLIECIPQNIRSGDPSLGYLRTALDAGVHVVTANKASIVLGYRDLLHRAAKSGAQFRFETTLLDGMPIFSMMSRMPEAEIRSVRGVFNGTSSLVLESVQLGSTRSRGLARAQALGIAEADSVLDMDGWDAAAKAALVANVWMGGALRVFDVSRTGCESIKDDQLRKAPEGHKYRLVAEITRSDEGAVKATVSPTLLEPGDPLNALRGGAGGITIKTKQGHAITMLQESAGLEDAAYGLMQDCYAVVENSPQV